MNKIRYRFHAILSMAWLISLLALAIYDYQKLSTPGKIQHDLLALLPASRTEAMTDIKLFMEDINLSKRVIILLGHPDPAIAKAALNELRQRLFAADLALKEADTSLVAEQYHHFFKELYPYRAGFLSNQDRLSLLNGQEENLAKRAMATLMQPFSVLGGVNIKEDPFSLYSSFIRSIQFNLNFQADENGDLSIATSTHTWSLYQANFRESSFSLPALESISDQLIPILDHLRQQYQVKVLKTGVVFYAAEGYKQANFEIYLISIISTAAIVLLLLTFFRSVIPLIFALLIIASGVIGGIFACFAVFGSIHIIALVFGCTLVGVTVDYALHYCCASYRQQIPATQNRFGVLKSLMPALPLGVLSSALGYGLLFLVPFPGIQQMSVLACSGLIFAFMSVCLFGPYVIKPLLHDTPLPALYFQNFLEKLASMGSSPSFKRALPIAALTISGSGSLFLEFDDDIRHLQSLNVKLKAEEDQIKALMQHETAATFFSVEAAEPEQILQQLEAMEEELTQLQQDKVIAGYRSLCHLISSAARQRHNRRLIEQNLYRVYWPSLAQALAIEPMITLKEWGLDSPLLLLDQNRITKLPEGWQHLIHVLPQGTVKGRIMVNDVRSAQPLQALAQRHKGVTYIDPIAEYTQLLATYRYTFMGLVLAIFLSIAAVVGLREGGKAMLSTVTPVGLAILTTVGLLGLCQIPLTLFHTLGLILVLCIGIDYSLFLRFKPQENSSATSGNLLLLGNALAAFTTLFSFGLLAFSKTAAPHDFGVAVSLGITICFIMTTILLAKGSHSK
ncbi:MMPL family transporter [Candidatus Odyssella thessalonicensis]|uniref:MMPL family transporter n=1 Tax=Candidatus Odyssella thessalonicensis TaxID=84647 RepID=UPI000225BFA5|nr:hypothetical protein [Candidatus Odyssella thessalonicensis]